MRMSERTLKYINFSASQKQIISLNYVRICCINSLGWYEGKKDGADRDRA